MAKGLNRKGRAQKSSANTNVMETFSAKPPERYLEKQIRRYVMASPDTGQYLVVMPVTTPDVHQYLFTNSIIKATKCSSAFDAKCVIRDYHIETGDNFDLVVIPLEITYELINETIESEISNNEYWEDAESWKK